MKSDLAEETNNGNGIREQNLEMEGNGVLESQRALD